MLSHQNGVKRGEGAWFASSFNWRGWGVYLNGVTSSSRFILNQFIHNPRKFFFFSFLFGFFCFFFKFHWRQKMFTASKSKKKKEKERWSAIVFQACLEFKSFLLMTDVKTLLCKQKSGSDSCSIGAFITLRNLWTHFPNIKRYYVFWRRKEKEKFSSRQWNGTFRVWESALL